MTDEDVESERIIDGFIRLILSFNLHFELPEENIVMKVFAERSTAKTFTEKLLLMLNREGETVLRSSHLVFLKIICKNLHVSLLGYSCGKAVLNIQNTF